MSLNDAARGSAHGRPRRRGAALEDAIYDAVVEEVAELGCDAASLEGIATRARIGRMSLYRRWPDKTALVLATLRDRLPEAVEPEAGAGPRERLGQVLASMFDASDRSAAFLLRVASAKALAPPTDAVAAAVRSEVLEPRIARLAEILRDAQSDGFLAETADVELLASTGPALLFQRLVLTGTGPTAEEVGRIVDLILPARDRE
ncbi:TetR/AcrR family transcriptional regulator [Agromyces larvae]|uniref:TetR/AcrR family transcriptional regulator n=1 Tax=Agromyces larvae TaxID=2929802 RepID=A0ABY4BUB2_9MICO|nr:TetR/AcrR family transcriptional regulator [Agromyces larvae]UOE42801.1 TetR/AcrR family transcriptional regulator [Agromyces larvae]